MLITWNRLLWITGSPFFLFFPLFFITYIIYYLFFRHRKPVLLSGAIVMALTIFAMTCLTNYDLPSLLVSCIALEILIIWFYIGFILIQAYMFDDTHYEAVFNDLAFGTWSAGTALLAVLLDMQQPMLHGFIILVAMVAIVFYLFYLFIFARCLFLIFKKGMPDAINGMVFLAAISTQSLVVLIERLFGSDIAAWVYQDLITIGYLLYFVGLLICLMYLIEKDQLLRKWSPANGLFYSAMAVNGLAIMNLNTEIPLVILHVTWWWSVVGAILIVGIEIYLWMRQLRNKLTRKELFTYATSQWLRLFSLTAFFAFTWSYYHQHYNESNMLSWVAAYGHYVITAFYLLELALLLKNLKTSNIHLQTTS